MVDNLKSKQYFEFFITIAIFVTTTIALIPWKKLAEISDFFNFYTVSILMQGGQSSQIYNIQTIQALEHTLVPNSFHSHCLFFIPPILFWILYPLAYFKFKTALYIWTLLLMLLVIVSCMILYFSCRLKGTKQLWLVALIATSGPYIDSLKLGQLSPFLLLSLTFLYFSLAKKKYWAAAFSQSLFWLKPHLLLPLLIFEFSNSQAKLAVLTCLLGLAGFLVSCVFGGINIMSSYAHLLALSDFHGHSDALLFSTLRGQLSKFPIASPYSNILSLAAYLCLLILALILGEKTKKVNSSFNLIFTCIVPLTLCLSLHLLLYDFLLLIPGIVLLSSYPLKGFNNELRIFILGFLALIFSFPIYIYIYYHYVLRGGIIDPFFWGTLVFALGTMIIEWRKFIVDRKLADNSNSC